MPSLFHPRTLARLTVAHPRTTLSARSFSAQARLSIKEDANHPPGKVEQIKQEQLEKQKRGEGHWHEELASAGESNITADKENVDDHDSHIEDLQKQTADKHEKDHPDGKAEH